jgi:hypothetical protein
VIFYDRAFLTCHKLGMMWHSTENINENMIERVIW